MDGMVEQEVWRRQDKVALFFGFVSYFCLVCFFTALWLALSYQALHCRYFTCTAHFYAYPKVRMRTCSQRRATPLGRQVHSGSRCSDFYLALHFQSLFFLISSLNYLARDTILFLTWDGRTFTFVQIDALPLVSSSELRVGNYSGAAR